MNRPRHNHIYGCNDPTCTIPVDAGGETKRGRSADSVGLPISAAPTSSSLGPAAPRLVKVAIQLRASVLVEIPSQGTPEERGRELGRRAVAAFLDAPPREPIHPAHSALCWTTVETPADAPYACPVCGEEPPPVWSNESETRLEAEPNPEDKTIKFHSQGYPDMTDDPTVGACEECGVLFTVPAGWEADYW